MAARPDEARPDPAAQKTVHILGIDGQVEEAEFARFINSCGRVVGAKICGDPRGRTLYGFVEFENMEGASALVSQSGATIGTTNITTSFARSSIRSLATSRRNTNLFDEMSHRPLLNSRVYCPVNDNSYIARKTGGNSAPPAIPIHARNTPATSAYSPYGAPPGVSPLQVQQSMYQQRVAAMYQKMGFSGGNRADSHSSDDSADRKRRKKEKKKEKKEKKRRRRSSSS